VPGATYTLMGQRAAIAAAGADWLPAVRDLWPAPAAGDRAPGRGRETEFKDESSDEHLG